MLDQKFDENVLKSNLLDRLLEILVSEDYVVRVAIDKQNIFVLNLSMSSRDACSLQVLLFAPIRTLYKHYPCFLLLPLIGYQLQHLLMVLLLLLGFMCFFFHQSGGFTIQELQTWQIFDYIFDEIDLIFLTGVVLKGQLFERDQLDYLTSLKRFDFDTIVSQE